MATSERKRVRKVIEKRGVSYSVDVVLARPVLVTGMGAESPAWGYFEELGSTRSINPDIGDDDVLLNELLDEIVKDTNK